MSELKNPSKITLLFRGSEHKYSAEKFHDMCDNIPHTLTLVRTEFKKTIAGYTPLMWNQNTDSNSDYFAADKDGLSFLLSLDIFERMKLFDKSKAIYCGP